MCGRARCTLRVDDIPRACHRTNGPVRTVNTDRYRPSYNVAPGSNFPVVRRDDGSDGEGVVLHCMKWGLIPSFTKKSEKPDFYKMFNARSESVSEKASFRRLLPKSRCLVAVEGFYEWKKDGSKKQPYYIHFKDGRPLVFAALYDSWESSEDRMPVILGDKGATDIWLNGSSSSKFDMMLKPYEDSDLVWYPVTPAMGKASFDGPECIKEIQLKTEGKNPISNFFLKKESKNEGCLNFLNTNTSSIDESVKANLPKGSEEEPNKEIKEEQELNLGYNSFDRSAETIPSKSLKEALVTADDIGTQASSAKAEHDLKSLVSILPNEGTKKCKTKRDYERFLADSKPPIGRTDKLGVSPVKRKGNLKDGDDKQPTLFSYFGEK
ncbi:uncharacterized protein LOC116121546 isoform X2 [Pistacia vera]|uniref:uncharacterized protein LOC116121540 isoform X2 n=1 Tax=Pistacia vera TaxID=55513 RepID=UPI001262E7EF|nr:uncharacterized protein LOC116121540 isoform X2 [Pistacia vera]XP_031263362.1 uncharacterized protein LOC116121546 isoform X2 [Pistacia vera]